MMRGEDSPADARDGLDVKVEGSSWGDHCDSGCCRAILQLQGDVDGMQLAVCYWPSQVSR